MIIKLPGINWTAPASMLMKYTINIKSTTYEYRNNLDNTRYQVDCSVPMCLLLAIGCACGSGYIKKSAFLIPVSDLRPSPVRHNMY